MICIACRFQIVDKIRLEVTADLQNRLRPGKRKNPWYLDQADIIEAGSGNGISENVV